MNLKSNSNRKEIIAQAKGQEYDVLVIGGGITGAGIALDAASRGFKTLLVEKGDFAGGTSSRSTKLIHGGLRYLKQFEIALVREVGRERAIVHKLAPHLVSAEKMLLPLTKDGTFGKLSTSLGLFVYDVLAGVEKPDQRVMLSKEEALEKEPLLNEPDLEGAGYYAEYRTDDARLTIEVIKTAIRHNAKCLNYTEATDFIYKNNQVVGVKCKDYIFDESFDVKAKYVVSAAGPWVDKLRDKNKSLKGKRLHLTKGVHIVVPHEKFPVKQAVYFDVPDGRMIFAIPRNKITYIGTTDTNYKGSLDHVLTENIDAEYLIDAVKHAFPKIDISLADVESSWAGLRPLIHEDGKSASELSRKDEIFESETGLISIAGGKLTGYRKMAERIVDLLVKKEKEDSDNLKSKKCYTDKIVLEGGDFTNAEEVESFKQQLFERVKSDGLSYYDIDSLVRNFGSQSDVIIDKFYEFLDEHKDEPLVSLGRAELRYGIENELIVTAADYLIRRTGRLYFDIGSVKTMLTHIIDDLADYYQWDDARKMKEKEEMEQQVYESADIFKEGVTN
mgnify:CR=1 FL=1